MLAFEFVTRVLKGPFLNGSHIGIVGRMVSRCAAEPWAPLASARGDPSIIVTYYFPAVPGWRNTALYGLCPGWLCPGMAVVRSGWTQAPRCPGSARGLSALPPPVADPAEQSHACSYHTFLFKRAMFPLIQVSWQAHLALSANAGLRVIQSRTDAQT